MGVMRKSVGSVLAIALCCVSVAANYSFGVKLAPGFDGLVYGVLGATADALKTILPLAVSAAFLARQWARVGAGTILFVLFSTYSLASAYSLYNLNRDATVSSVKADKASYKRAISERNRLQNLLATFGRLRPLETIKAEIEAGKVHKARLAALGNVPASNVVRSQIAGAKTRPQWRSTRGCTPNYITLETSRKFCQTLAALEGNLAIAKQAESLQLKVDKIANLGAELATAIEAEKVRLEISAVNAKIDAADLKTILRSVDPQTEGLAKLTGQPINHVKTALAVMVALIIELGSGLGLWIVTGGMPATPPKMLPKNKHRLQKTPKPLLRQAPLQEVGNQPVKLFAETALQKRDGNEVFGGDLYLAFQRWSKKTGIEPVSHTVFGREITALGFDKVKRGGRVRYVDVELCTTL